MSGSLRAASSNSSILRAAELLAPAAGMVVEHYDDLGRLPHFNPDLEERPPAAGAGVARARRTRRGIADLVSGICPWHSRLLLRVFAAAIRS
jgi:chromate reductase, NAD(P)H dehydrogenase (quinone)